MATNKNWLQLLAYVTGSINQEQLLRNEYLAAENLSAAHTVTDHIEKQLQSLQRHPFLGKVPSDVKLARMGYRVLVGGDYLGFYKVRGKTVLVYRIIHEARDILPLLDEL